jgi:hypothetical protein
VAEVTQRDRKLGRRLPDEFVKLSGTPINRVTELVTRYWPSCGALARAQLAHALLLPLESLIEPGAALITNRKRQACEDLVTS